MNLFNIFHPKPADPPAPKSSSDACAVSTSVLGEGHGFHRCLSALLGPDAGLTIHRQESRVNGGYAERFEVSWWMRGERQIVRGVCQSEVGLAVADILESERRWKLAYLRAAYNAAHDEILE